VLYLWDWLGAVVARNAGGGEVRDKEKAAIVAALERLAKNASEIAEQSQDPFSRRLAAGMSLALSQAIQVVQAGGALPLETSEDGK